MRRIAQTFEGRINLIHHADLLPPPRYVADHKGDPSWCRTPQQQALWRALLKGADVLWDFPARESSPLLDLAPRLGWLQTTSAGVGPLVRQFRLIETDVLITTASGVHAGPLTEFVFATLLFHTKRLAHIESLRTSRVWERFCGGELRGQTIAIVGAGRIGREVARVASAFGMTVWAMACRVSPARFRELGVDRVFGRQELKQMLSAADCVVLCVPQTPETDGMIGRSEIEALKQGVVFINIGRGTTVDESALIEALRSNRIGLAGLDVFQQEPLPLESPLWDLPNVFVNPHSASTADTGNMKLTDRFIANLRHYLAGDYSAMEPQFDKSAGY